ncbi:MAG: chemotaxis protein CheB [Thermodesulfobacteriota bacterium]
MDTAAYKLIVIGGSAGGLQAMRTLLGLLPTGFKTPLAVVLHRQAGTTGLSAVLQQNSPFPVLEAEDKTELQPGHLYLAPADYHLLVEDESLALSTDAPVASARPSIDVLFESAAEAFGHRIIGVLLTGKSQDGAAGLASIKERGGLVIIQDPRTAEEGFMPAAALAAVPAVDYVLPLPEIGAALNRLTAERKSE